MKLKLEATETKIVTRKKNHLKTHHENNNNQKQNLSRYATVLCTRKEKHTHTENAAQVKSKVKKKK